METVEFLRKVLPSAGLYVIARLTSKGKFKHQVCDSIEEAAGYALNFDQQGVPTYHACAAYRERDVETIRPDGAVWHQVRTHGNVRALKSFWMDLDVGPDDPKKYASQEAAVAGLCDFILATELPLPMVISSGGGVHLYWSLADEILPETWKQTAAGLKALAIHHGLLADHACTADSARILRPIGTYNRKLSGAPRAVELVTTANPLSHTNFAHHVSTAISRAGLTVSVEAVRRVESPTETINQAFAIQHDFPPCSGAKVAERCQQVKLIRDKRGDVPEPLWYAGIQLLCHSIEADPLIHEWSNGYAGYSETETNNKIHQIRSQHIGPTLCDKFASCNPSGCDGCPFKGKISSPVQLGAVVVSAPAPIIKQQVGEKVIEIALPSPPTPYTRQEGGGITVEIDGITHKIYEHDFFPVEAAFDEQLGYETTRYRHYLPHEGWKECVLQSSLLARPVDFEAKLRDHHVQPLVRNQMAAYADAYLRTLKASNKMRKLFQTQGWKTDDTEFVLGTKLYTKDGVAEAGMSAGAEKFLAPFHSKGSLDMWRALTTIFNTPGFEPHAFMLLLAFASPLLKLAGLQGFTVCALGSTGIGKSTMAGFMSSVWGHPHASWCKREDTKLARMQRFGAHYSLPVYMDESTTIANKDLRDLIYEVPTGAGRDSMRRDYTLRPAAEWATLFVTSTNDSLQSKLQLEKQNAEAEGMRLFEFRFPKVPEFGPMADIIPGVLADNYGVAGETYANGLVMHRDEIKERLATAITDARTEFDMEGKERFWSQAIALSLYGGALARQWGIIDFDPAIIKPWLRRESKRMRGDIKEGASGSVAVLSEYLDAHVGERLVVTKINAGMGATNAKPNRELTQRLERDTNTLYVARSHIKFHLDKRHFNYTDIRDDLIQRGVLMSADSRKVLGAGTDFAGGQVPCWKIKADHPELSGLVE